MLRLFYVVACILSLANGAWMLLFPYSWYTDFPAAVHHTGPFNPHFIRDLGAVFVVIAVAFAWSARNIDRAYPVHLGLTLFFAGHALIHLGAILSGQLPHSHWLIDTPGVFVPALIMIILAVPQVRKHLAVSN